MDHEAARRKISDIVTKQQSQKSADYDKLITPTNKARFVEGKVNEQGAQVAFPESVKGNFKAKTLHLKRQQTASINYENLPAGHSANIILNQSAGATKMQELLRAAKSKQAFKPKESETKFNKTLGSFGLKKDSTTIVGQEAGVSLNATDPLDQQMLELAAQISSVQILLKSKGPMLSSMKRATERGATCCGGIHADQPVHENDRVGQLIQLMQRLERLKN
jgi:hypothetical protein